MGEMSRFSSALAPRARAKRSPVPRAVLPAPLPGWQAGRVLRQAVADPAAAEAGRLEVSPFRARAGLLLAAVSGRV
jgi:hypothetical protein